MKIDNSPSLPRPGQTEPRDEPRKAQGTDPARQQDTSPSAKTHLGQGTTDTRQDIDTVRVEELRDAIREGRLDVRADRIADGLITSVQDLLAGKDSAE
ncbi:MAG: flagellar biosynthesis anti-sigma factor FlgM [Pseudomonadota bacterium]